MSTSAPKATDVSSGQQTREVREAVVVRFAGDSGDGMQLTGSQFTLETALAGLDLTTFPDYPAEIRAPVGTTFGVSAFQIHFGSVDVKTAGDEVDVLVAMNPAALKVSLEYLRLGGTIVADTGSFGERNLAKAGYDANPLEDDTLAPYQVIPLDIAQLTMNAVDGFGLSKKEALRCRNMWALGLMLWMYDRDLTATAAWLTKKFSARETLAQSNNAALKAGHAYGETAEMSGNLVGYRVKDADLPPGEYRTINGTEALV
jgi:2-oxoglutarate ferredoxin oxidoreductase subunit alpha